MFGTLGAVSRKARHLRFYGGGMKLAGNGFDVGGAKRENHGVGERRAGERRNAAPTGDNVCVDGLGGWHVVG